MDSRLLATLNSQASGTRDPVVWARAVCRAASHFARHGRTNDALKSIGVVRAHFGNELHHEVASWLMLAEGVLHFFRWQTHEAYDRIRRAYGLAIALQNSSAIPSCAAWMAHIEFNEGAYERMISHVDQALKTAAPDDHQALARASLVLADAYQLANSYPQARPWYEKARQHATAEGDEATLSAILYNVAAFRTANLRLIDSFGEESASELHRASMETSSSATFDFAIGTTGLEDLTPILRGTMLTLGKKFSEAIQVLETIDLTRVAKRLHGAIFSEIAWCNTNLGQFETGWRHALKAIDSLGDIRDDDDIAYTQARIVQTAELLGKMDEAQAHLVPAREFLLKHREFQAKLLLKLELFKGSA